MKKLLKELKKIEKKMSENRIFNVEYYNTFSTQSNKEKDLKFIETQKRKLLSKKYNLLENLQLEIEKEKAVISYELRKK